LIKKEKTYNSSCVFVERPYTCCFTCYFSFLYSWHIFTWNESNGVLSKYGIDRDILCYRCY